MKQEGKGLDFILFLSLDDLRFGQESNVLSSGVYSGSQFDV